MIEAFIQVCTQVAINFVQIIMKMTIDLLSMITNPGGAAQYAQDLGQQFILLINWLGDSIIYIMDAIFQMPLLRPICPIIKLIVDILTQFLGPGSAFKTLCDGVNEALDWIDMCCIPCPSMDPIASIQCDLPAGCGQLEPTVCTMNNDCFASTAYCVIAAASQCRPEAYNPADCPWNGGKEGASINNNEAWAAPCPCSGLVNQLRFCNRATGLCEAGVSPFGPPLNQCPAHKNELVDDTIFFNQQCWLFPAYKTQYSQYYPNNMAAFGTAVATGFMTDMEGPVLCRNYCDPSSFNRKNWLLTDNRQSGNYDGYGCVCMIGSVYYPTGGIDMSLIPTFMNFNYAPYYNGINPIQTSSSDNQPTTIPVQSLAPPGSTLTHPSTDNLGGNFDPGSGGSSGNGQAASNILGELASGDIGGAIADTFDYWFGRRRLLSLKTVTKPPEPTVYSDVPYAFWLYNTTYCDTIMLHYALIPPENRTVLEAVHVRDCEARALAGARLSTQLHLPPTAYRMFTDWDVLANTLYEGFTRATANISLPTLPDIPFRVPAANALRRMSIPDRKNWTEFRQLFIVNRTVDWGLWNETVATSRKLLQKFSNIAFDPWTDVAAAELLVPSEAYTFFKGGISGTCKAGSAFVDSTTRAMNNLYDAFRYNVKRSSCRMTKPDHLCPQRPLPSPKAQSKTSTAKTTANTAGQAKTGNPISDSVFGFVNSIFGVDLMGSIDSTINYLFTVLPNRKATDTTMGAANTVIEGYMLCNYDAIQCQHKRTDRSILASFVEILAFMAIFGFLFSRVFFSPGFVYGLICTVMIYPITMKVHYNVNFGCSTAIVSAVPICLVDDVVETLDSWFGQHIQWPGPLINNHARMPNGQLPSNAVIDCSASPYGFITAERSIFYALERWAPSWRHYISGLSVGSIIGSKASKEMSYYLGKPIHQEPYPSCFYLTLVNAIPLILILIVVFIFLVGAVQVILTFVSNITRALDDLVVLLALVSAETVILLEKEKKDQ